MFANRRNGNYAITQVNTMHWLTFNISEIALYAYFVSDLLAQP